MKSVLTKREREDIEKARQMGWWSQALPIIDKLLRRCVPLASVRTAVAEYRRTEGCSCCEDHDGHDRATARLAKLLNVPKYSDDSGYDFSKSKEKR